MSERIARRLQRLEESNGLANGADGPRVTVEDLNELFDMAKERGYLGGYIAPDDLSPLPTSAISNSTELPEWFPELDKELDEAWRQMRGS